MLTQLKRFAMHLGFSEPELHFLEPLPFWCPETERFERAIIRQVRPYTQTSPERVAALCQSVAYLERMEIPGAIVECGVWKGGSMMAAASTLLRLGSKSRDIYLFDTFTGMTPPDDFDIDHRGNSAHDLLAAPGFYSDMVRAHCNLEDVRKALGRIRYPSERVHFVPGRVEETLPDNAPQLIALLRLDTDWYASTRHELETLYPRLAAGGVLIIDDYGHWRGSQRAVDEYFAQLGVKVELHAIDYSGRLWIKKTEAKTA